MSHGIEFEKVECCKHGLQQATFVCQHLSQSLKTGNPCGFHCADPEELRSDAWCDECNEVLILEGEWNDKSAKFAGVKLLCGQCYDLVRSMNE